MWSEKQKDHIKVKCRACRKELDAEFDDAEELNIIVAQCESCVEKADESSFNAGYEEGITDGYEQGYSARADKESEDD